MEIAITLLALISGASLVAGYFLIKEIKQALAEIHANRDMDLLTLRHIEHTVDVRTTTPSEDRLKLLEQKVAAIQMKR